MKIVRHRSNQIAKLVILLLGIITLSECKSSKVGGTIPVFMDEYVSTTAERRLELTEEIEGYIIKYQKAYDCNHDFYKYNATAIISYDSGFITIYDFCQQRDFKKGDKVIVKPLEEVIQEWSLREILEPLPKSSENYGFWQCVSCKYNNAFGSIELAKIK